MKLSDKYYGGAPRVTSEYMDVTMPFAFDQYNNCAHNCLYCFAFIQRALNPCVKTNDYGVVLTNVKAVNVKKIKNLFLGKGKTDGMYKIFIKRKFLMHWGCLNDPFCPYEKRFGIGLKLIKFFAKIQYPIVFQTKGNLMVQGEYWDVFKRKDVRDAKNFHFQFSMTMNSDELSRKMEKGVVPTSERFKAMKKLSDAGYWVSMRLSPYLIGLSCIDIEDFVRRAKEAGCRSISTRFGCVQRKATPGIRKRYEQMSDIYGYDIYDYFVKLSPTSRGTYLRLNRDLKARYFKRLLKACIKYKMELTSYDPDFRAFKYEGDKEYSDQTKYNPLLAHHNHFALSFHMKRLRNQYWKTGQQQILTWDDILKSEEYNWMRDFNFYHQSLRRFRTDYKQKTITPESEYQSTWNNLRSSKNPYLFFQGELEPIGLDNNKNIIYKYVPQQYDIDWHKEGLI